MNQTTPEDLDAFYAGLDINRQEVARDLVRTFAVRAADLLAALNRFPQETTLEEELAAVFIQILTAPGRYDPARDPGFSAFLYGRLARALLQTTTIKDRRAYKMHLAARMAKPPHELTVAEIASALSTRESEVVRWLESEDHASSNANRLPLPLDVEHLADRVARALPFHPPPRTKPFSLEAPIRELIWVAAGLAVILILILSFNLSDASELGRAIFPTPSPFLPTPISSIAGRNVQAPIVRADSEEKIAFDLLPVLSRDGTTLLFTSNRDDLTLGDENQTYDVFIYDIRVRQTIRITQSLDESIGTGYSFGGDISSSGDRVVFTQISSDGNHSIWLWDRDMGRLTRLYSNQERELFGFLLSPRISGDGSIVAYFAPPADPESDDCGDPADGSGCFSLFIHDVVSGEDAEIPLGISLDDAMPAFHLSEDGAYIALTLNREMAFKQLGSGNETEAVLVEVATGNPIPLNLTAAGDIGNGPSRDPVISGDGRYAAFLSLADDLSPEDTNEEWDVFLRDLVSGITRRISPAPDGRLESRSSVFLIWLSWGNLLDISTDGRYVLFLADPDEKTPPQSVICGFDPVTGRLCQTPYLYDRLEDSARPLDLASMLAVDLANDVLFFPSVSDDGRLATFLRTASNTEFDPSRKAITSIWLLDLDRGMSQAVPDAVAGPAGEEQPGKWTLRGSIPAPNGWVNGVAVHPNGELVGAAMQNGEIILATFPLGTRIHTFQAAQGANAVAFSPDGRWLAAGSRDRVVTIWDINTGQIVNQLFDHPGMVFDVAFSPSGDRLAVGSQQALWIWDLTGEEPVLASGFSQTVVSAVAFSPDSRWIASTSGDQIWIRDAESGEVVARLAVHRQRVQDLAFSPLLDGGYYLGSASHDETASVWWVNAEGGGFEADHILNLVHGDWVSSIAFSPDGALLATGSFDNAIQLWNLPDGGHQQTLQWSRQDQILSLAFSPDGNTLISGTVRALRVWQRE